jgi:hypothetical protein
MPLLFWQQESSKLAASTEHRCLLKRGLLYVQGMMLSLLETHSNSAAMFLRVPDTPLIVLPATLVLRTATACPRLPDNAAGVRAAILGCSWLAYADVENHCTKRTNSTHGTTCAFEGIHAGLFHNKQVGFVLNKL